MKQAEKNIATFYLIPSSLFLGKERTLVTTILGSCVAVCLYDPVSKIGAINHFMLPYWNGEGLASPKYGNIAVERLIELMVNNGTRKENLIAKVFGGANQINSIMQIGDRNIQIAEKILKKHQIKLVAKSLGGEIGRKLIFDSHSGEVRMKYLGGK